ncbi:MAG: DUF4832 domain-containing protein [Bacteroidales bacterium]|nr:DUF4832 domain-containing protein [Bacteroidales bacterium]
MKILYSLLFLLSFGGLTRAQQLVTYTPSEDIIINPERGFYAHKQSTNAATLLKIDDLINLRENEGISLILMIYYLPDFIEGQISETALLNIETNFNTMREAGVKCVLRFAYRWNQNTRPYEPTVEIVETHISQLTPVLKTGSDVIAVMQAGFIGVWGEWYYTTNFGFPQPDFEKRNKVVDGLLNALPERRMIQLRTPTLKYGICDITSDDAINSVSAFSGTKASRIGHHNDCFLASSTDYGTYNNIEEDKAFLEDDTRYLTMGGETCNPSTYSGCTNAVAQMNKFHWSYLNSGYHHTVLSGWETGGCMTEVKKKLGYRFTLTEGIYTQEAEPGGCFSLDLKLTNLGWAAPYNRRDVEIILKKVGSTENYWIRLPENPQWWLSRMSIQMTHKIELPPDISEGTYQIFLNLPDPEPELFDRPEYSIQVANLNTWDSETGFNSLNTTLEVKSSATTEECNTSLSFKPFPRVPHLERITSVNKYNISDRVRLYPNPLGLSQDLRMEFTANHSETARLRVISFSGQIMVEEAVEIHPGSNRLELLSARKLSNGPYILSITGSRSYFIKRFSIQK